MSKTFKYFDRNANESEKSFDLYKDKDGQSVCAISYLDGASSRLLTHGQYDKTISAYNGLQDRWQKQMLRQARWDLAGERDRQKLQDPATLLSADERKDYLAAMQTAGLDHSDQHMAAIRDCCLKGGAGRHEAVYNVNGRFVFEGQMTPQVISFSMGTQNFYEVPRIQEKISREAAQKAWLASKGGGTPAGPGA